MFVSDCDVSGLGVVKFSHHHGVKLAHLTYISQDREHWEWMYTAATTNETLRDVGYWARDAQAKFTWYDAAVVTKLIRMTRCHFE